MRKSLIGQIRLFAGVLQAPGIFRELSYCLHTSEDAGSNPASPTKKYLQIAGKFEPPIFELGCLVQPYCNAVVGLGGK